MIGQAGIVALGALLLGCSGGVVISRNLVHGVFWLAGALLTTAALMVVLHAPFIAGIQVLLYTGGVITLMLFGVMLTQRQLDTEIGNPAHRVAPAGVTSALLLAVILGAIWTTPEFAGMKTVSPGTAEQVATLFLTDHLLAFEVLSVLLLAAMVGAIVLARRKDP